jgi:putative ABC transport system ATP-binding protein
MAQAPLQRYLPRTDRCTGDALIEMKRIVKTFKNAAGEFTALKDITACFYEGEFVSIVGKSGSGKSTLANMLTGIDHPTSGTVRVGEAFIHQLSESHMSLWRGRNLGIVFQFFQLMPILTLLENVLLPMVLADKHSPLERENRARDLLRSVGLAGLEDKLPAAVSGGQQQCAAIARALANDPPILIADEPTGNLDSRTADEVFGIFARLIQSGKTILMVTHDAGLAQRTTRTLLLSDGELVNPWVAAAFPDLLHPQMLWLTHHLVSKTLSPGDRLAGPGGASAGLWLVTDGQLEVVLDGTPNHTPEIVRLHPGETISQMELEQAGALLKAGGEGMAEVLSLEDRTLQSWLQEVPAVQADFRQRAEGRLAGRQPRRAHA